ncbi:MAG TPA: hypothetical protein PKW95_04180 [bacterium]|nr:hypothetical protein [bacterium]
MKRHIWFSALIICFCMILLISCSQNDDDDDDDNGDDDATDDDTGDDDSADDDTADDDTIDDDTTDDDDDSVLNNDLVWGRYLCGGDVGDHTLVTVGSYNLHGGNEASIEELAQGIADHLPFDLLFLQECPEDYSAGLAAELGMQSFRYGGLTILSFTELLDPVGISLEAGRSVAHATTSIEGVEFSVYAVHLGWNSEGDAQCREFIDDIIADDPAERIIAGGDWNEEPGSSQFDILYEQFADSWSSLGLIPSQRVSWPANMFYGTEGALLIDNNLFNKASGACAVDGKIVNFSPILADHKLQFSTIAFPPTAAPQAPYLLDAVLGFDENVFALLFDKPMIQATVTVHNDAGELNVVNAEPIGDGELVLVTLNEAMPIDEPLTVTVTGGQDIDGNVIAAGESLTFVYHENLIADNGFEEGGAAWTLSKMEVKDGDWWGVESLVGEHFVSGLALLKSHGTAEQTIDVSAMAETIDDGRAYLEFGGFSRTGYMSEGPSNVQRPYDETEAVAKVFDADGRLLAWYSSGRLDTLYWQPWRLVEPLPPGAREVRITLRAVGGMFGLLFNAASFDGLHLSVVDAGEPHGQVSGNLVTNPLFEDGFAGWEKSGLMLVGVDRYAGPIANADINSFTGEHWVAGLTTMSNVSLTQTVDLSAYAAQIEAQTLTAAWGGAMRPLVGLSEVSLFLTFLDDGENELGADQIGPFSAAEWFRYTSEIQVPGGARSAVFTWRGGASLNLEAVVFDAPFIFLRQNDQGYSN